MIDAPTRALLHECFRKIATQERATIVSLGFLQTHAHLLIRTGPRYDLLGSCSCSKVVAVTPRAGSPRTSSVSDGIGSIP